MHGITVDTRIHSYTHNTVSTGGHGHITAKTGVDIHIPITIPHILFTSCQCYGWHPHTQIPPAWPFHDTACSPPPRHLNCTSHPRCHAWAHMSYGPTSRDGLFQYAFTIHNLPTICHVTTPGSHFADTHQFLPPNSSVPVPYHRDYPSQGHSTGLLQCGPALPRLQSDHMWANWVSVPMCMFGPIFLEIFNTYMFNHHLPSPDVLCVGCRLGTCPQLKLTTPPCHTICCAGSITPSHGTNWFIIPPLQRSWKGGILVSPCPSVRLWTESCPLCIFNNTHRIHFIFAHLIKQLQKVCRV